MVLRNAKGVENYPSITGYLSKISLAFCMLSSDGHAFVREMAKVIQSPKKRIALVFMARQLNYVISITSYHQKDNYLLL